MDDTLTNPTQSENMNQEDDENLKEVSLAEGENQENNEIIVPDETQYDLEDDLDEDESEDDFSVMKFKRSHVYAALLPLAFVSGLLLGFIFWGRGTDSAPEMAADVPVEAAQEVVRYDVPEDDDPVLGPDSAPITIIEFSDYECPYCRRWHLEVWPLLQEEYGDQIRLVYRDFPLTNIHASAVSAASAANCAGEQDAYWDFNELLFSMELGLDRSAYQSYAQFLGLNETTFNDCLESGKYDDEVQADLEYAANLGVRSTPTFFINGLPVVGAQPFEVFKQVIDQELAGEIP